MPPEAAPRAASSSPTRWASIELKSQELGVDLGGDRIFPAEAQELHPALHLADHERHLLAQAFGRRVAQADDTVPVRRPALLGVAATGQYERAALRVRCGHRVGERVHRGRRGLVVHGAHIGARHRVHQRVAVLVDAPAGKRLHVDLVEVVEALVGERLGRTQLALRERGRRPADCLEVCFDGGIRLGDGQRLEEARALDFVAGLGGNAAGVLEHGLDVAVVAGGEDWDIGHGFSPCKGVFRATRGRPRGSRGHWRAWRIRRSA